MMKVVGMVLVVVVTATLASHGLAQTVKKCQSVIIMSVISLLDGSTETLILGPQTRLQFKPKLARCRVY